VAERDSAVEPAREVGGELAAPTGDQRLGQT